MSLAHNCFVTVIFSAFHTYRINLSPFTKDFRVWGALTEIFLICLLTDLFGGQSTKLLSKNERHERKFDNFLALDVFHCLQGPMIFKDRDKFPRHTSFHIKQGIARTQSPTNKNYAAKFPTFGEIVGVNRPAVQWNSLVVGELPP